METLENREGTDVPSSSTITTIPSTLSRRTLPGKDADSSAFDRLLESWNNEYKPDTDSYREHVRRAAHADFVLRYEEEQHDLAHEKLWAVNVSDWDAKQMKQSREWKSRVDSAERSFMRWVNMVEKYRRTRLQDKTAAERHTSARGAAAENKQNALNMPSGNDATGSRVAKAALLPYLQVIEVRVEFGETKTIYNPPNRNVLMMLKNMGRKNQSVRRILHLPENIPFEYRWAENDDEDEGESPRKLEWVVPEKEYIAEIEQEEKAGRGHVLKSRQFPVRVRQLA